MADHISFSNAKFATHGMLPSDDEEVTALWGRKAANAALRAYGEWSTIVLGTHPGGQPFGVATIFFDSLGFTNIPTIDVYQVLGGTQIWRPPIAMGESYSDIDAEGVYVEFSPRLARVNNRQYLLFSFNPNPYRDGNLSDDFTVTTQAQFGTFLIRLRGV